MIRVLGGTKRLCDGLTRRDLLRVGGMGLLGLGSTATATASGARPASFGRAKSCILLYLYGAPSQIETFDPKPALNKYAGKTFQDTPFPNPFDSPLHEKRSRSVIEMVRERYSTIFPMQVGFSKRGESGIEVTDWWPQLATCVDDMAFVRSMYTTDHDGCLRLVRTETVERIG